MGKTTFSELESVLRDTMKWTGVPDVIESDGGPPFNSGEFKNFCSRWKIKHRLSSPGYAQSNGRSELGVKTAKRIVLENMKESGSLDTDNMVRALLQYRNTPLRGINKSPAEIVFGHAVKDCLPQAPDNVWRQLNDAKEESMAKIRDATKLRYDADKHDLSPLKVGDEVILQNQTGPHPKRWQRYGFVTEVCPNRQYYVKISGSNRVLLRNRKHLKLNKLFQESGVRRHLENPVINPSTLSPPQREKIDSPQKQKPLLPLATATQSRA